MTNNLLVTLAQSSSLNRLMMVSMVVGATTLPLAARAESAVELPAVTVEADRTATEGYKANQLSSPKFTKPLLDTPQSVTVVPRAVMEDRGATNLRDVLRNVTGISLAAGEGGTPSGDNLTLRGFSARTDMFLDGMRDFGGYFRDPFTLEQVEVVKGPSSTQSGRGSTGGSINQVSKTATLENFQNGTISLGTDNTKRVTSDVNYKINDTAAIRLNAMVHDSDVAGRDIVENKRWGVAPTLSFGLGTDTRSTLSYFHLQQENIPDYGHFYLNGRPAPVDIENFYGLKDRDYEDVTADIATAKIEHDINETFSFRNQLRYGHYNRGSIATEARGANFTTGTIDRSAKNRDSIDTLLQEQADLTAKFATGTVKHTVVTGVELAHETSENQARTIPNGPVTNVYTPNPYQAYTGTVTAGALTETNADSAAVYAFDTIELNKEWGISGGLRYDRFDADFNSSAGTNFDHVDNMLSWKGGVTYKPLPNGTIYFTSGTSFNPSAEALSLSAANASLDPEESITYELGTKWDLLDKKVALSSAIFRTDKTNVRTVDPIGSVTVLEGEQRVDGFEFGVTGQITKKWQVFAGYTYLDSSIEDSKVVAEIGKEVLNVAPNTFSLWTTYELPYKIKVGGGAQYTDRRFNNNLNANKVPEYWRFDAMASYGVTENVDLQLNVYNLANEEFYESISGGRIVPGAGRSAMITTSVKF